MRSSARRASLVTSRSSTPEPPMSRRKKKPARRTPAPSPSPTLPPVNEPTTTSSSTTDDAPPADAGDVHAPARAAQASTSLADVAELARAAAEIRATGQRADPGAAGVHAADAG